MMATANSTVATVCNKLVRMLGHGRIKVILDHKHDSSSLPAFCRVLIHGPCKHWVLRPETIHVYAAVYFQFFSKFSCQNWVVLFIEISQRIPYCQLFLGSCKYIFTHRSVVHVRIVGLRFGKLVGDALKYGFLKFICIHNQLFMNHY